MIVLMGTAGAGKGTQGKLLVDQTGFNYISTGDMLRQFASDSQRQRMLAGDLLTDEEIIAMVDQALAHMSDVENTILDGFPRNLAQVDWLLDQVAAGRFSMPSVVNLDIDETTVHQRLIRRGRQDDSETVISHRYRIYQEVTLPVLDRFREASAPLYDIDADQSPEAVHADVIAVLDGQLNEV